jgi:hypothetical protein
VSTLSVKREEYKYFINNADIYKLSTIFNSLMKLDKNTNLENKEYTVTSLYFETLDDEDLDEKIDGILVREKHRLRLYNHNHSIIKLETKKRNGTVIAKDSAQIEFANALDLISGCYNPDVFENGLAKLITTKLKSKAYRPRVIVEYDRLAYYLPYGDIRITFDKNLRTYNTHTNLLELSGISKSPIFLNNNQILEIKFGVKLPSYLIDVLETIPSTRSSISKYALCQRFINHDPRKDYIVPPF